MNRWKKPLLINGAIIAALLIWNMLLPRNGDSYIPRFAMSGTLILLMAPVNLIVGMIRNRMRKADGAVYIAFPGILLLIGFSVCTIP